MDEISAEMVIQAETLAASNRIEKLAILFEEIRKLIPDKNYWYLDVYFKFYKAVTKEFSKLQNVINEDGRNLSEVSWRCRNLLELRVWLIHFKDNRDNVRRFNDDAANDFYNMLTPMISHGNKIFPDNKKWLEVIGGAKDHFEKTARENGIDNIDGKYVNVTKIAETTDIAVHYSIFYKIYSKFTHPTAISVLSYPDEVSLTTLITEFYFNGSNYFNDGLDKIEYATNQLYKSLTQGSTYGN